MLHKKIFIDYCKILENMKVLLQLFYDDLTGTNQNIYTIYIMVNAIFITWKIIIVNKIGKARNLSCH